MLVRVLLMTFGTELKPSNTVVPLYVKAAAPYILDLYHLTNTQVPD